MSTVDTLCEYSGFTLKVVTMRLVVCSFAVGKGADGCLISSMLLKEIEGFP